MHLAGNSPVSHMSSLALAATVPVWPADLGPQEVIVICDYLQRRLKCALRESQRRMFYGQLFDEPMAKVNPL